MIVTVQRAVGRLLGGKTSINVEVLKKLNLAVAVVLIAQAVAILLFSGAHMVPVYISFLTGDGLQSKLQGTAVSALGVRELTQINLAYLLAGMLLASAVGYLLVATLLRVRYEAWLKKSWQPLRWVVIAVVGASILGTMALLAGLQQLDSLKLIAILVVVTCLTALQLEMQPSDRKAPLSAWVGVVVGLVATLAPWLLIGLTLVASNVFGSLGVPAYQWWLFGTMLAGWLLFIAHAHLYHIRYGKWHSYLHVEFVSTGLILLVETAFVWQLFAAVLKP